MAKLLAPIPTGYPLGTEMDHPQVQVTTPDGHIIEVDEQMVNLLQALWQKGIITQWSCQGNPEQENEPLCWGNGEQMTEEEAEMFPDLQEQSKVAPAYIQVQRLASATQLLRLLLAAGEVSDDLPMAHRDDVEEWRTPQQWVTEASCCPYEFSQRAQDRVYFAFAPQRIKPLTESLLLLPARPMLTRDEQDILDDWRQRWQEQLSEHRQELHGRFRAARR